MHSLEELVCSRRWSLLEDETMEAVSPDQAVRLSSAMRRTGEAEMGGFVAVAGRFERVVFVVFAFGMSDLEFEMLDVVLR